MNNLQLLGNRVLIKLDEHPEHSTTPSGIIVARFNNVESDGGRPKVEPDSRKHLFQGTVVAISPYAASKLSEESTPLFPGDRVYLSQQANSSSYQFFLDRATLVPFFDGHIAVPHTLIEAKILPTNGN